MYLSKSVNSISTCLFLIILVLLRITHGILWLMLPPKEALNAIKKQAMSFASVNMPSCSNTTAHVLQQVGWVKILFNSSCQRQQHTSSDVLLLFLFAERRGTFFGWAIMLRCGPWWVWWAVWSWVRWGPNGAPRVLSGVGAQSLCLSADQHHTAASRL